MPPIVVQNEKILPHMTDGYDQASRVTAPALP
jgi:hypothetical protein